MSLVQEKIEELKKAHHLLRSKPPGDPSTERYYRGMSIATLSGYCRENNIPRSAYHFKPLDQLIKTLATQYSENHPYSDWDLRSLIKFLRQRKIKFVNESPTKQYAIALLEKADQDAVFPIMSLPPELRNRVSHFAFAQESLIRRPSPHVQQYTSSPDAYYDFGHGPYAEHALTKTSRQIRAESLPLFYGSRRCFINEGAKSFPPVYQEEFLALRRIREGKMRYIQALAFGFEGIWKIDFDFKSSSFTLEEPPCLPEDPDRPTKSQKMRKVLEELCKQPSMDSDKIGLIMLTVELLFP